MDLTVGFSRTTCVSSGSPTDETTATVRAAAAAAAAAKKPALPQGRKNKTARFGRYVKVVAARPRDRWEHEVRKVIGSNGNPHVGV